jgi:hypothetical protein
VSATPIATTNANVGGWDRWFSSEVRVMTKRYGFLAAMLAVSAVVAPAAKADIVTWTVRGTVSVFSGSTPAIPFAVSAGEQYVLTLLVDDSAAPAINGDVSSQFNTSVLQGTLNFANGAVPLSFGGAGSSQLMTVTNDAFSLRPTGIVVTDSIEFSARATPVNQYNNVVRFDGSYSASTPPTILTSHNFPAASEVEAFFAIASATGFAFTSDIAGRYYAEVRGNVQSVEVSAVPLPAAGWLLFSASGALLLRRRHSIA